MRKNSPDYPWWFHYYFYSSSYYYYYLSLDYMTTRLFLQESCEVNISWHQLPGKFLSKFPRKLKSSLGLILHSTKQTPQVIKGKQNNWESFVLLVRQASIWATIRSKTSRTGYNYISNVVQCIQVPQIQRIDRTLYYITHFHTDGNLNHGVACANQIQ